MVHKKTVAMQVIRDWDHILSAHFIFQPMEPPTKKKYITVLLLGPGCGAEGCAEFE